MTYTVHSLVFCGASKSEDLVDLCHGGEALVVEAVDSVRVKVVSNEPFAEEFHYVVARWIFGGKLAHAVEVEEVALEEYFLPRQVGDDILVDVRALAHVKQLDGLLTICDDTSTVERFYCDRARLSRSKFREVVFVSGRRENRGPFGHEGACPTCVIVVEMRYGQIAYRFVGNCLFDLFDKGFR